MFSSHYDPSGHSLISGIRQTIYIPVPGPGQCQPLPCLCKFRLRCQPSSTPFLRPSWSWNTRTDNNERHTSTSTGSYCSWSVIFCVDFLCHLKIATGGPTDWVSPEYVVWSASNSAGPGSATYDSQNAIIQAAQSYAKSGPWSTTSSSCNSAF